MPDRAVVFGDFAEAVRRLGMSWLLLNQPDSGGGR
jgi:hypothetical protein